MNVLKTTPEPDSPNPISDIEAIDRKLAEITEAIPRMTLERSSDLSNIPEERPPSEYADEIPSDSTSLERKLRADQLDLQRSERLFDRVRHLYDIGVLGRPHVSEPVDIEEYNWKERFRDLLPAGDLNLGEHEKLHPRLKDVRRVDSNIELDANTPKERIPEFPRRGVESRAPSAASKGSKDSQQKSQGSRHSLGSISSFLREDYIKSKKGPMKLG